MSEYMEHHHPFIHGEVDKVPVTQRVERGIRHFVDAVHHIGIAVLHHETPVTMVAVQQQAEQITAEAPFQQAA